MPQTTTGQMVSEALAAWPGVSSALVLGFGIGLAFLLRAGFRAAVRAMERFLGADTAAAIHPVARVIGLLLFWAVVVETLFVALRLLGIQPLSAAADHVLAAAPRLLAGVGILGVGHLLAVAAREFVRRMNLRRGHVLLEPRAAYGVVLAVAALTGLEQMGLDLSVLTGFALIASAAVLAALGLAFALGARQHAANLIAAAELSDYRPGDRIRIEGIEGTVSEVRRTRVLLLTDEGTVSIPAARFASGAALRLRDESDDIR